MARIGKKHAADLKKAPVDSQTLEEAVKTLKGFRDTKFDQTIEVCIHTGLDTRQADQNLRGAISLPHGVGATKRVIAFVAPEKVDAAKEAGAVEAGGEDLVAKIEGGWLEFDVAVAEPAMMRVVARLGKQLGPKGLMPSPKAGTVTPDVPTAVGEYAAGKVEYRADSFGNVAAPVGKKSFTEEALKDNINAFVEHITKSKPSSVKGVYIKKVAVSATMTPSVTITL